MNNMNLWVYHSFVSSTWSWCGIVSIETRLEAGQYGVRSPTGARGFLFSKVSKPALRPTQLPSTMGSFCGGRGGGGQIGQGMSLASHFHLLPRLGISGAVPQLTLYAIMACSSTTYSYLFHIICNNPLFTCVIRCMSYYRLGKCVPTMYFFIEKMRVNTTQVTSNPYQNPLDSPKICPHCKSGYTGF
jgi:hypothetical protein